MTMKTCLDGLIQPGGDCGRDSAVTLEEIGLYLDEINDFADGKFKNGRELAESKIHSAIHLTLNDIHSKFRDKYKMNVVLGNEIVGHYNDSCQKVENRGDYSGIELDFYDYEAHIDLYVSRVKLNLLYTGESTLYVYDLKNGKQLDAIPFTSEDGCETIVGVDKVYKSMRSRLHLAFLIDSKEIGFSYKTKLKNHGCSSCEKGNIAKVNRFVSGRGIYIKPDIDIEYFDDEEGEFVDDSRAVKSSIRGEQHTSGITVEYSCQCNHDDWVCQYKNKLIFPVMYRAGIEILKYALHTSDCLNNKTTLDAEKLQLRVIDYQEIYDSMIGNLLSGIKVPYDNNCFECREGINLRNARP